MNVIANSVHLPGIQAVEQVRMLDLRYARESSLNYSWDLAYQGAETR